jgi:hypothetical protein
MRKRFFFFLVLAGFAFPALAGAALSGCGDTISIAPPDGGGVGGGGFHPSTSTSVGPGGNDGGMSKDALPDYVDPGCPDSGPPGTMYECDPFNQFNGDCPPGEGCYIYVQYPSEPCGQEIYGATCIPVGSGGQGDPCEGPQACGAGFVCVVSGSGNQCVQLCPLQGNDNCPSGYVCEPIDVEGFGGCL